jgi:enamine deaminase RidA (YjgF/YER057c/UK114 family)
VWQLDKELREAKAKNLLSDELFNEAFTTLETDIKDTWYRTSLNDTEAREQAWLSLRLLERIRLHLTSIIESGDMARKLGKHQL